MTYDICGSGFDDADGGAASGAAKMSFEGEMGFDAFLRMMEIEATKPLLLQATISATQL